MASTEPLTGLTIQDQGDAATGGLEIGAAVAGLAPRTVLRFASPSDRDTKYNAWLAAGNSDTAGLLAYTGSDKRYWRRDSASTSWMYAGGNPPPVVAVTGGAGWSVVSAKPAGCYVDASGLVHLLGNVAPNTSYNPTDGATHTAFQLPAGYRPAASQTITVPANTNPQTLVEIEIHTDGVGYVVDGSTTSVGANVGHVLDGVQFHPTFNNAVPFA